MAMTNVGFVIITGHRVDARTISDLRTGAMTTPTTTTRSRDKFDNQDLKTMVGVIHQEEIIKYHGVAKIRTFASRSGLSSPRKTKHYYHDSKIKR